MVATGGGDELRATVTGGVAGEGFVDTLGSYVEVKADGDRCKSVSEVVVPDEVSLYGTLLDAEGRAGPGEVEEELIARAWGSLPDDTCLGIGAVVDTVDTFAHLLERLVFGTEEDDTLACAEAIIELALGTAYSFDGAEALEVRPTDVGDESVVGFGDGAELIDIPRLAGAHLDESKLMLWGEAQEGQGDTDMIIEVALGIEEAVGRREDGGRQLLRRRLTIRPSDRDDGGTQLLTMVAGEQL